MDASSHLQKSAVRENHAGGEGRLGVFGGIVDSKSSQGGDGGAASVGREFKGGEAERRTGLRRGSGGRSGKSGEAETTDIVRS